MYLVFSMIEKGIRGARIISKLAYYKMKYGKRLKVGKDVHFRKGFIINISKNGKLEIGRGNFFNNYCSINCRGIIVIGENNLFGEGVKIYDHNHVFNRKDVNMKKAYKNNEILIGNKNWFGSNVVILSKARIGDNNVFSCGMTINSAIGSDNIVKTTSVLETEKIKYKDDDCA